MSGERFSGDLEGFRRRLALRAWLERVLCGSPVFFAAVAALVLLVRLTGLATVAGAGAVAGMGILLWVLWAMGLRPRIGLATATLAADRILGDAERINTVWELSERGEAGNLLERALLAGTVEESRIREIALPQSRAVRRGAGGVLAASLLLLAGVVFIPAPEAAYLVEVGPSPRGAEAAGSRVAGDVADRSAASALEEQAERIFASVESALRRHEVPAKSSPGREAREGGGSKKETASGAARDTSHTGEASGARDTGPGALASSDGSGRSAASDRLGAAAESWDTWPASYRTYLRRYFLR